MPTSINRILAGLVYAVLAIAMLWAVACGGAPPSAVQPKLVIGDPGSAGTIACVQGRDDLQGTRFLQCTAHDMTLELGGRSVVTWRIPLTAGGEPCCNATLPCCGPTIKGCPCDIMELMELKNAYPSSCHKGNDRWTCAEETIEGGAR